MPRKSELLSTVTQVLFNVLPGQSLDPALVEDVGGLPMLRDDHPDDEVRLFGYVSQHGGKWYGSSDEM